MPKLKLRRSSVAPAEVPDEVYLTLVGDLCSQVFPLGMITLVLAAIGSFAAIESRDPVMGGLVGIGVAAGLIRLALVVRYGAIHRRRGLDLPQARRWDRLFSTWTIIFAAFLGLACAKGLLGDDAEIHLLIVAVLFAYGSGVVSRLVTRPALASTVLIVVGAPVITAILTHLEIAYILLGLAFLAFLAGGLEMIRKTYAANLGQLVTRHEFSQLARYDILTGLPNRLLLRERLDAAMAAATKEAGLALHYVDLDRFKQVNDTHGHRTGDELLRAVAGRLSGLLAEGDTVARIGGDEFVVLQVGATGEGEGEILARRIVREISLPFSIDGNVVSVSASVGVALAPVQGRDLDTLIACADAALYRIKDSGRDGFAMFDRAASAPRRLAG